MFSKINLTKSMSIALAFPTFWNLLSNSWNKSSERIEYTVILCCKSNSLYIGVYYEAARNLNSERTGLRVKVQVLAAACVNTTVFWDVVGCVV
jgi:hypothetical protein